VFGRLQDSDERKTARPCDSIGTGAHYRYAREAYRALGAEAKLRIGLRREGAYMLMACPEIVPPKAQN